MRSEGALCLVVEALPGEVKIVVPLLVLGELWIVLGGRDLNWRTTLPASEESCTEQLATILNRYTANRDRVVVEEFVEFGNALLKLTVTRYTWLACSRG